MWKSLFKKSKAGDASNDRIFDQANSISHLLSEISLSRGIIIVRIMSAENVTSTQKYSTAIINVNTAKKIIELDELIPKEANDRIKPGTSLLATTVHQGCNISFNVKVLTRKESGGAPLYFAKLPTKVKRVQQRNAFRVKISSVQQLVVQLMTNERPTLKGLMIDVSATGLRIEVQDSISPSLKSSEIIENLFIKFDDKSSVRCKGEIRHWLYDRNRKNTIIGVRFIDIDGGSQRLVNRFINDVQRKELMLNKS
jgi:c-di-GMP-binding flagellar brake protein YcgR